MLIAWLLFPLVLGVLALGCGALVERVASVPLPGALVLPVGLAVIIVAAQLATLTDATAELAMPLVVVLALAGLVIARPWRNLHIDPWAAGAGVAVFAIFAAPVVLSGDATWAGYLKLDDTSTWFSFVDRAMEHGRNVNGLAPSTYQDILKAYFNSGYPLGAYLPLGVGRELVGQDVAWLFQPYVAFLGAMLALSLYAIAARLIEVPWQRALAAVVGAQSALLFGYSLVGGIKEMTSAWLIALAVALLPTALDEARRLSVLPLAVVTGAALAVVSFGGMIWLLPVLLGAVVILFLRSGPEVTLRRSAWFAGLALLFCLPALPAAKDFLSQTTGILTQKGDVGGTGAILISPLNGFQIFGVWPVGDFRLTPGNEAATYFLVAVVIAAGLIGLFWAWTRRAPELFIYVAAAAIGAAVIGITGSPWVGGKALAIASPVFVFAAMVGAAALFTTGRRFEAALVAAAIAGGVVWSNVLAYHEVDLAPRDRMAQLEEIGHHIKGEGPTLMVDVSLYGAQHFLRDADPQRVAGAASFFRPGRVNTAIKLPGGDGVYVDPKVVADVDSYKLGQLEHFRTLLLPHSPASSRPPSVFKLTERTKDYEVWQRPERPGSKIVEHLSLPADITGPGSLLQPVGAAFCSDVRRLARRAGPNGRLATVERRPTSLLPLSLFAHPPSWKNDPLGVYPTGSGTIAKEVNVKGAGRYDVWLNGAFRQPVSLKVDGKTVGRTDRQIMLTSEYAPLGAVELRPGVHKFELRYGGSSLYPGSGGEPFPLGPIILGVGTADAPVRYVPAAKAEELCGKTLDWVEALRS